MKTAIEGAAEKIAGQIQKREPLINKAPEEQPVKPKGKMEKSVVNLHNALFTALERINDDALEDEDLRIEVNRAKAVASLASQIIAADNLMLKAYEMQAESNGKKNLPGNLLLDET